MKTHTRNFKLLVITFLYSVTIYAQDNNPKQIVLDAINLMNGITSKSTATMSVVRPKWTRSISMRSWSLGNDYNMILITSPAKDKGQTFLKRENEMWNWIPTISRIVRIPPSMMGQSWMGSDFTNNDLVKRNSLVNDYEHTLAEGETIEGYKTYKITLTPKKDAAVIWGRIILYIAKKEHFILKGEYYDESGTLVNLETQTNIKHFTDRDLPSKLTIVPVKEKGKKTVLEFEQIEFNVSIKKDFFSQQNMKSLR
ncbi:MAG: outer membrane lipoprotein-sorting protein [Chitinophagales bacterium]|nr:outer membrane lipoprotein-sorting protein [Chitinophagaceae bacterium]MCB0699750.1 outer membrane lipoprotein-sorting protein [Chitinophagaceae bacterium]MCB9064681.1 outer membrane lipoprotein-sorting protein [Chitinophagales bacterium]